MAECGICLDALRNPVAIPCGHVHCESCLCGHISAGADALRSTCPTCRKSFYIATPDLAFVPQKYHDFILPSVRRVYMDIPSLVAMTREIDVLTKRLETLTKQNEALRQRCADNKHLVAEMHTEQHTLLQREAEAQQQTLDLRKKYDSLKKRYREAQSHDDARSATPSQSSRDSQNFDVSHEILPKVEEHPVSLQDLNLNQHRPKRALPRSRLSMCAYRNEGPASQVVKKQRTHRHSDIGSSSQIRRSVVFKGEESDEEEEEE